jgi:hypothetical protein
MKKLFKKQLFDLEVKGQSLMKVKACPDHNFFAFPDRSSIIFGMWVHDHKVYRNDLHETLTFDLKVK